MIKDLALLKAILYFNIKFPITSRLTYGYIIRKQDKQVGARSANFNSDEIRLMECSFFLNSTQLHDKTTGTIFRFGFRKIKNKKSANKNYRSEREEEKTLVRKF